MRKANGEPVKTRPFGGGSMTELLTTGDVLAALKSIYPADVARIDWSLPPSAHYSDCALLYDSKEECTCAPAPSAVPADPTRP